MEMGKFAVELKARFYFMRFKTDNIMCKLGNIMFNLNFQQQLPITGCMCPASIKYIFKAG